MAYTCVYWRWHRVLVVAAAGGPGDEEEMKKRQDGFVPRSHSRGHNSPIRRSPTRRTRYDGDKQVGAQKTGLMRSHIDEQAAAPLSTTGWLERVQQQSRQSSPLANASSAAARGRRKGTNSPGARRSPRSPLQRDHPDAHRSGTRAHHYAFNNNAAAGFTEPLLIFPASGSPREGLFLVEEGEEEEEEVWGKLQPNPDAELATAIEVVDWQQKEVSTPF